MTGFLSKAVLLVLLPAVLFALFLADDYREDQIIYELQDMDSAVFSHEFHVKNRKFDCADCHSGIFRMTRDNFTIYHERDEEIMPLFQKGM